MQETNKTISIPLIHSEYLTVRFWNTMFFSDLKKYYNLLINKKTPKIGAWL